MLSTIGCGRPYFEGLLQRRGRYTFVVSGCGRPYFEGLLQLNTVHFLRVNGCGRPYFEGLLQRNFRYVPFGYVSIKLWKTLF